MAKVRSLQSQTLTSDTLATLETNVNTALASIGANDLIKVNFETNYDIAANLYNYSAQIIYIKYNA